MPVSIDTTYILYVPSRQNSLFHTYTSTCNEINIKKTTHIMIIEQRHEISNNVVCATSKDYAQQSEQSIC